MEKPVVSLIEVERDDIEKAVRLAVEKAGSLESLIGQDSRVVIKPNLNKASASGSGDVTDARVTEAVTRMVLDMNPGSVVIADGAAAGYDFTGSHSTGEAFRVSGTDEVARRLGVATRNLNTDTYREVLVEDPLVMDSVKISTTILESDVIISVPVLKSHVRTISTVSLKNMKGVMPGEEKRKTHRLGLDLGIADLISVVKPHFTIVDATTVLQGLWEPEDKVELGLILAGYSPFACDIVASSLIGFDPDKIMHISYSMKKQGIELGLDDIDIRGAALEEKRKQLKSGFDVFRERYPGVKIVEGKSSCSGCMGELIGALTHVRHAGFEDTLKGLTVLMGAPIEEEYSREKLFCMGKCCSHLKDQGVWVGGCPPLDETVLEKLAPLCGFDIDQVMHSRDELRKKNWESTREALYR